MSGALDRLVGMLRGTTPRVSLRPRSRFEPAAHPADDPPVAEDRPPETHRVPPAGRPASRSPAAPTRTIDRAPEPVAVRPVLESGEVTRLDAAEPPAPPAQTDEALVESRSPRPAVDPPTLVEESVAVSRSPSESVRSPKPTSLDSWPVMEAVPEPRIAPLADLLTEHVIPAMVTRGIVGEDAVPGPADRDDVDVVQAVGDPVVLPVRESSPAHVHVHIGRVDVQTPAPAPSPAPPANVSVRPLPDLVDYLARRKEDRR